MNRPVPLWLFLFCLLLGSLVTVAFGWTVKSTVEEGAGNSVLGQWAVGVASFPTTTYTVFQQLVEQATGDYKDVVNRVPREITDLSGFQPISAAAGINIQGLLVHASPAAAKGWRLLLGAFTLDGQIENAALLISPQLRVERRWILTESGIKGIKPQSKYRKFVHGAAFLPDASLIFAFDGGLPAFVRRLRTR